MKPALVIGSTCIDVIINIDHLPTTAENLHPTGQTLKLGGCAYNVTAVMRLLDAPHRFISPVGGGVYGDYVRAQLTKAGVPISVSVPEEENGCCYCLVEASGERTFMSYHGVEYTFQKEWMKPYDAGQYSMVYICGLEIEEKTGINLIEYLEEHPELTICFAPGPRGVIIGEEKLKRLWSLHPILHINEQEALQLSEQDNVAAAAAALQQQTGNTVIVTLGEQGTYCLEKSGDSYTVPTVPATVKDTIGAGDSHVGTIIACLVKDIPLKKAIAYANKVAGAVVGIEGATLSPEQVPAFTE